MGYMENELNDLEKGTIYTTEEIASIVNNKNDALVLSEDTSFFRKGDTSSRYLVMNKLETFIHRNDEGSYSPRSKQLIYIVKKCM